MSKFTDQQITDMIANLDNRHLVAITIPQYIKYLNDEYVDGLENEYENIKNPNSLEEAKNILTELDEHVTDRLRLNYDDYTYPEYCSNSLSENELVEIDGNFYLVAKEYIVDEPCKYFSEFPKTAKETYAKFMLEQEVRSDELSKIVDEFETKLSQAESFATKHKLEFSINPAYGMGGNFSGGNWNPSSQSC